jgi:antirestriction protein ArdC
MNTDQAKALSETALNNLIAAIEAGPSDALKNYLRVMSRFTRYSWGNILMIYAQRPEATQVAGFHAWLKLGRHVRKGEKGIVILAPMVGRKKGGAEVGEDEQTRLFGFRSAHVWDLSQTDGSDLPEFATVTGDPGCYMDRVTSLIAADGIALEYTDRIAPAKGVSYGGRIEILPGMSAAETLAVLVHELSHERLHKAERRQQTSHVIRETEAEAVAFVVCSAIGLDTNSASADYVQLHGGDKATLVESLSIIQQTAASILGSIMPESP